MTGSPGLMINHGSAWLLFSSDAICVAAMGISCTECQEVTVSVVKAFLERTEAVLILRIVSALARPTTCRII